MAEEGGIISSRLFVQYSIPPTQQLSFYYFLFMAAVSIFCRAFLTEGAIASGFLAQPAAASPSKTHLPLAESAEPRKVPWRRSRDTVWEDANSYSHCAHTPPLIFIYQALSSSKSIHLKNFCLIEGRSKYGSCYYRRIGSHGAQLC